LAIRAGGYQARVPFERRHCIPDGYAQAAESQERPVVLRVADGYGMLWVNAEFAKRRGEASGFVDTRRDDHHLAAIANQLPARPELLQNASDSLFFGEVGLENHTALTQFFDALVRQSLG
jgi:hypothetical protein